MRIRAKELATCWRKMGLDLEWLQEKQNPLLRLRCQRKRKKKLRVCNNFKTTRKLKMNRFTNKKNKRCSNECPVRANRTKIRANQSTNRLRSKSLRALKLSQDLSTNRQLKTVGSILKTPDSRFALKQSNAIRLSQRSTWLRMCWIKWPKKKNCIVSTHPCLQVWPVRVDSWIKKRNLKRKLSMNKSWWR